MSRTAKSPSRESAVRVFVSYSHKDSYWMDALMPLLRFPGVRDAAGVHGNVFWNSLGGKLPVGALCLVR